MSFPKWISNELYNVMPKATPFGGIGDSALQNPSPSTRGIIKVCRFSIDFAQIHEWPENSVPIVIGDTWVIAMLPVTARLYGGELHYVGSGTATCSVGKYDTNSGPFDAPDHYTNPQVLTNSTTFFRLNQNLTEQVGGEAIGADGPYFDAFPILITLTNYNDPVKTSGIVYGHILYAEEGN